MNKLSYGLLSLLSTKPMAGYDLMLRINKFWRSTHSAIYPLLSELEEDGYVEFELKKQFDKPDKKIYRLTEKGIELLQQWFISETSQPVVRDEMSFKLSCMQLMDDELVERLLAEIDARYKKKLEVYKEALAELCLKSSENREVAFSESFGTYVLLQRVINEALLGIEWCTWVRSIYKNKEFQFLNQNFKEMMEKK